MRRKTSKGRSAGHARARNDVEEQRKRRREERRHGAWGRKGGEWYASRVREGFAKERREKKKKEERGREKKRSEGVVHLHEKADRKPDPTPTNKNGSCAT